MLASATTFLPASFAVQFKGLFTTKKARTVGFLLVALFVVSLLALYFLKPLVAPPLTLSSETKICSLNGEISVGKYDVPAFDEAALNVLHNGLLESSQDSPYACNDASVYLTYTLNFARDGSWQAALEAVSVKGQQVVWQDATAGKMLRYGGYQYLTQSEAATLLANFLAARH